MGDSKPDVQMLCHQIVAKVSEYSPGGVLSSLDALIEPLEKTCNKQVCPYKRVNVWCPRAGRVVG